MSEDRDTKNREEVEDNRPEDDTISDSATCPECGSPIENLRATCSNCGYEYKEGDYDDPDAGEDFLTGSQIDEDGNEQIDEEANKEASEESNEEEGANA